LSAVSAIALDSEFTIETPPVNFSDVVSFKNEFIKIRNGEDFGKQQPRQGAALELHFTSKGVDTDESQKRDRLIERLIEKKRDSRDGVRLQSFPFINVYTQF
jgi:hypothetical protein